MAGSHNAIDKMPLGALAEMIGQIKNQTQLDSLLARTLPKLNRERITVAHRKSQAEGRLRRNGGRHMFRVINALRELLGVT